MICKPIEQLSCKTTWQTWSTHLVAQAHTHARMHRGARENWPWSLFRICQGQTWWCKESCHRSYPAGKQKETQLVYKSHPQYPHMYMPRDGRKGPEDLEIVSGVVFNGRATTSTIGGCSMWWISDKSWMDYIGFKLTEMCGINHGGNVPVCPD